MSIKIQNKLEILPGNVLRIPGNEPTTAFSSDTLAVNMQEAPINPSNEDILENVENNQRPSIIDLSQAIDIITEITGCPPKIEKVMSPSGFPATGKFLVLPEGTPKPYGCDECSKYHDWYSIFSALADPINVEDLDDDNPIKKCVGFNYSGKRQHSNQDLYPSGDLDNFFNEVSNLYNSPDPEIRPNNKPLGGYR